MPIGGFPVRKALWIDHFVNGTDDRWPTHTCVWRTQHLALVACENVFLFSKMTTADSKPATYFSHAKMLGPQWPFVCCYSS